MNVVRYELVCYECGLLWRGLLWRGLIWRGLLWTWSVMKRSVMKRSDMKRSGMKRSVMNVVCFEWSVMIGLLWTGLFWTDTTAYIGKTGTACSSLMSAPLPAEAGCRTYASGLFCCCSLLCNNNMATNLQMFTSCCDSRRFVCVTVERKYLGG